MAHEDIVLARERGMFRRKEEYGVGGSGRDTSSGRLMRRSQIVDSGEGGTPRPKYGMAVPMAVKDTKAHRNPNKKVKHKDSFFDVLFESLVTSELTIEHQYISLLFSVDGLQHPLVDGLPRRGCERLEGQS